LTTEDSPAKGPALVIRQAQPADVERILDLIEHQEFIRPLTREQVRRLFTYTWADPKPDVGLILTAGDTVAGLAATVYSPTRTLDGLPTVTLNAGTLFVAMRYRARRTASGVVRYSEELARAVMRQGFPVLVFSARGPNDVVPKILLGLGFEEVCSADRFYAAGTGRGTLWRPSGAVVTALDEIRRYLTAEQRTILRDHEPYGCRFFVVREGERSCLVVTKRRRYRAEWLWPSIRIGRIRGRYFPVSDILHVSDPAVAAGSWGRLVAHVARVDRAVGVTCTESFLDGAVPRGTRIPQRLLVYGRTRSVRSIDKLYTEQVLLR
jgi:hypothetical protein